MDVSYDILHVIISQKAHEELIKPWKHVVVVHLVGRAIGYRTLCFKIQYMWKPNGDYRVINIANEYYLV